MKVVIIHNDPTIVRDLPPALQARAHQITLFSHPIDGWDYLKARPDDDVLVTAADFGPGSVNGLALAHVARARKSPPLILFVAPPQWRSEAKGLGELLELGTPIPEIVKLLEDKTRPLPG